MRTLAIAGVMTLAMHEPASAETVAIGEAALALIGLAAAPLAAIASWALIRLAGYVGIRKESAILARLDGAIERGIAEARDRYRDDIAGWTMETESAVIGWVVGYIAAMNPEDTAAVPEEKLRRRVRAQVVQHRHIEAEIEDTVMAAVRGAGSVQ